jgi:choline dehydrogenase
LALYDSFAVITPATLKAAQEVTMPTPTRTFDYIVVGAGSAGAIVAARLTEDPGVNVLLLEADSEDDSYWSKIPLGFARILFNPRL